MDLIFEKSFDIHFKLFKIRHELFTYLLTELEGNSLHFEGRDSVSTEMSKDFRSEMSGDCFSKMSEDLLLAMSDLLSKVSGDLLRKMSEDEVPLESFSCDLYGSGRFDNSIDASPFASTSFVTDDADDVDDVVDDVVV